MTLGAVLALLVPALGMAAAGSDPDIVSQVTVEVGRPAETGDGPAVELVPGTVISIEPLERGENEDGKPVALVYTLTVMFRLN